MYSRVRVHVFNGSIAIVFIRHSVTPGIFYKSEIADAYRQYNADRQELNDIVV